MIHLAESGPVISTQDYNTPNNREWALLIWVSVVLVLVVWKRDVRQSIWQLIRVVLSPKLLVPLVLITN